MRVLLVALLVACGSSPPRPPPPPPAPPPVRVEIAASPCIDAAAARARIAQVLAARHATHAGFVIDVGATQDGDATALQLRVTRRNGEIGLERSYPLGPSDCGSAPDLLALGIDRFLDAFPHWASAPPPAPPPAPPATRWVDITLRAAASSMFAPLGFDGSLGGALDYGARTHRAGATLLVRASAPQDAGPGRFQQTAFLLGAAYRFDSGPWRLRAEVRGGGLLVRGTGFDDNASDWLPWWEGAVFAGRGFAWGALGIELAASGLQHDAVTSDGLVTEDIPQLRLGFAGELGVWSSR
jgi:hypothetical protein